MTARLDNTAHWLLLKLGGCSRNAKLCIGSTAMLRASKHTLKAQEPHTNQQCSF